LAKDQQDKEKWLSTIKEQITFCQTKLIRNKSTNDLFKSSKYEGLLNKRGENRKNWKRRYFKFKGKSLFYYVNPEDHIPLGMIALQHFELFNADDRMKKPFCIELRHQDKRCWFLQAESALSLFEWLTMFGPVVVKLDGPVIDKYMDPVEKQMEKEAEEGNLVVENLSKMENLADIEAAFDKIDEPLKQRVSVPHPAKVQVGKNPARKTALPISKLFSPEDLPLNSSDAASNEPPKKESEQTKTLRKFVLNDMESLAVTSGTVVSSGVRQTIGKKGMAKMIQSAEWQEASKNEDNPSQTEAGAD